MLSRVVPNTTPIGKTESGHAGAHPEVAVVVFRHHFELALQPAQQGSAESPASFFENSLFPLSNTVEQGKIPVEFLDDAGRQLTPAQGVDQPAESPVFFVQGLAGRQLRPFDGFGQIVP
jgi:hypothetical protein